MKENIDQLFKEKFENLEIQPRPVSKIIFLQKAAQKKSIQMFRFATKASAAVILISISGYFITKHIVNTTESQLISFQEYEKKSDENAKPETDEIFDKKNHSKIIYSKRNISHSKNINYSHKNEYFNKDNSLNILQVSDLFFKDTTAEHTPESISMIEPEIEIKITGFSEQIVHYSQAEYNQKPTQISFHLLSQKLTVHSPVFEEVDQVYHQLKKGLKDFNLADASRAISNNLVDRFSSRKYQNQNNN
ncbi:MAG: hypothetical protein ACK4EX_08065 [Thermaurantimonas sp.]|uniref:hypothetical protein n=1 Tax=Thermaurantimonas sp. TaxID=2681568 RepID=UPI00391C5EFC